jgi:hypothetical protein
MIPKVIHYTWFSGEPFPESIKRCIDSWHQVMPDYEYVCWNAERIKEIDSVWVREALAERKWAFAADFVRLYAVYNYGGIYLDTDCFIYKSFDDLLQNQCFIGKESSMHIEGRNVEMHLTAHCFGAEAQSPFIARCMSYYKGRHYITTEDSTLPFSLRHGITMLPYIQSEIAKQYGYNPWPSADVEQHLDGGVTVYPSCYFDVTKITKNAYCKHLAVGAWRETRLKEEKITLWYKIRWRLEAVLKVCLNQLGYILIKKI